jgi:hypothetical protein
MDEALNIAPPYAQMQSPGVDLPGMAKPKGGMFGGGFGLKQALAFGLAGLVARRNPMLLQGLLGMMAQKQQMAQREQEYQQHRNDDFADWQKQYDYSVAHPKPVNNDTAADYDYIASKLGSEAALQFLKTKTDPVVNTQTGPVLYSNVSRAQQGPLTDADIDRLTGGAGSPAPRPFR